MKPWLILPSQVAHAIAPVALQVMAAFRDPLVYEWKPFTWRGLHFKNRLGIAGGVDKNAEQVEAWWTFGPGHLEIGTVTPKPQAPNPGRIMNRDIPSRALWNKMGFPGGGVDLVHENLRDLPLERQTPLFANIGKNRWTPNDEALTDYVLCLNRLAGLADVFVINISSPNTTGLRELLEPKNLNRFLGGILAARDKSEAPSTPVLLKLSPDIPESDLAQVVNISLQLGIDGFIATNTTLSRDPGSRFPAEGGVSGKPLAKMSKRVLKSVVEQLGSSRADKLVISAGGVITPEDVVERLELGADLVQIYTTLVYEGPYFFKRVAQHLDGKKRWL